MPEGIAHREWDKKNKQRKDKNSGDVYALYPLNDGECLSGAARSVLGLRWSSAFLYLNQLAVVIPLKIIFKCVVFS